jgi:fibronectin type 3 domain-containing protein
MEVKMKKNGGMRAFIVAVLSFTFFGCGEVNYYLTPPQNLRATYKNKCVEITWEPVFGAEYYEVQRSNYPDHGFARIGDAEAGTFYLNGRHFYRDRQLILGNTYYYRVQSKSSDANAFESIFSETVFITIK